MYLCLVTALLPLLDDRPPVEDLHRFPLSCIVETQLRATRQYQEHLEGRIALEHHHYWELNVVLGETRQLHDAWDALRWAHRYSSSDCRRDMLKQLRGLIGPDAYYAGRMPPCVPLHRFTPRD